MFGKIKHLIFVLLVIIAGSNSPAYALQTIQAGEYSISFKGGDFDKSIMKGNCAKINIMLIEGYILQSLKHEEGKFRFRDISICNHVLTLTERLTDKIK